jgi:hypothetical protein
MKLIILESPFAGDVEKNRRYACLCMRDCLMRDEAPFASHLLYAQEGVLKDNIPEERKLGMEAGFAWGLVADATAVYTDLGVSEGMRAGIQRAETAGHLVYRRTLPAELLAELLASP